MSYCRFHNTLADLKDCHEHMDDHDLSAEECKARKWLIKICRRLRWRSGMSDLSLDTLRADVDSFLETLPEPGQSQWPNRLLMEIECITDPVELETVKILIDERIAWLKG